MEIGLEFLDGDDGGVSQGLWGRGPGERPEALARGGQGADCGRKFEAWRNRKCGCGAVWVDHIDAQLAAPLLLALGAQLAVDSDAATLEALRGPNASDVRKALALSMIEDHDAAAELARKHGLLVADHPFLDQTDDLSAGDTELSRWPLSTRARDWLLSLRAGADVEATLLWMMANRTGLDFGSAEFTPWMLRRKTSIPITTFAEMFGME